MAATGTPSISNGPIEGRIDGSTHSLPHLLQALCVGKRSGCLSLSAARGKVTGAINISAGRILNARLGPFTGETAIQAASAIRRLDYVLDKALTDKTASLPEDCLTRMDSSGVAKRLNLADCTVFSVLADGTVRGGRSDEEAQRYCEEYAYLKHYGDRIGIALTNKPSQSAVVWEAAHCLGYREGSGGVTGIIAPSTHSLPQLLATL